ncbi:putative transmembrane protein [Senna tora]|uniref:Putative transmembrane protein n=1 Tax=Senna tora TaxID=362788 RepID=A0A834WMR8_9FABA|nr:putative transmembrane protein [Senna tora]
MKLSHTLVPRPFTTTSPSPLNRSSSVLTPNAKRVFEFGNHSGRFHNCVCSCSGPIVSSTANHSSPVIASNSGYDSGISRKRPGKLEAMEEDIEKVVYRCRFMAILGVFGSLVGSILCFIKGCSYVTESFMVYFINRSKVIPMLVEAIDVYLLGTVMLVFGMGLYELFVSNLGSAGSLPGQKDTYKSNLFGLFTLKERPKWLDIKTVNELKTKLGHVIVMLLLIGLFDKSKKAAIHTPADLLCFCAAVCLSSSCLFLLSKLNGAK